MENILVSVIIPVYNTESYIEDCLNSVLGQSYKNLEIILINDGSTDNSAQICRKYLKDSRVMFIDRENRGLSKTRQQGIEVAKGTFFCNLDSDDMLDTHFVETMLRCAMETGADIVTCGRKDFDEEYSETFLLSAKQDFYALTTEIVSEKFDDLSRQLWLADSWNKLYRTDFVRNSGVNYWLDNRYNGTDLSFNHLLLLHSPQYAVVNEPLLLHRIVNGSRVHRKNKPLQEGFEIITDRVLAEAEKLGYGNDFKESYSRVYAKHLKMVVSVIVNECENLKELRGRILEFYRRRDLFKKRHPSLAMEKRLVESPFLKEKILNSIIHGNRLSMAFFLFFCYQIKNMLQLESKK